MDIILASGNTHKRMEFAQMLPGWNLILPSELGIPFDPDENGTTFIENALIKAHALASAAPKGSIILSDDSGLCVDALAGGPGIHTARYGMKDGKELPSAERNALLLRNMEGKADRTAQFVCALALVLSPHRQFVIEESVSGAIAREPFGNGGFGYDPIFLVDEAGGRHMASLSEEEKDRCSHRGKATRHLLMLLEEMYGNKTEK